MVFMQDELGAGDPFRRTVEDWEIRRFLAKATISTIGVIAVRAGMALAADLEITPSFGPRTSKTRPVTFAPSGDASQVVMTEIQRGDMVSMSSSLRLSSPPISGMVRRETAVAVSYTHLTLPTKA